MTQLDLTGKRIRRAEIVLRFVAKKDAASLNAAVPIARMYGSWALYTT